MPRNALAQTDAAEFETLRQVRETQNEIIINYVQLAHFGLVSIANVTTRFFPVAPYRASTILLALFIGTFLLRLGLFVYLRNGPIYNPSRKFVIATFDLVVFTAAPLLLASQGAYPALFLGVFVVCIYSMLVVLSGLRYSQANVLYCGVSVTLLHAVLFVPQVPSSYKLPVLVVGVVSLPLITICVAYSVASLIRMHHDAVLKQRLSRFLPPELVEQVAQQSELLERKTERKRATVIFVDIRGFTRVSEEMPPEIVVEILNDFLEEMTSAIMRHQGMLDKYIGDAVMGVFGVPFHAQDHALRALRSALNMRDRLSGLNEKLRQKKLPELSIGIGFLHTGELLIGAIGSSHRLDYTVVGDTVNTASRIEGLTRSFPVEILLSDATAKDIGDAIPLYRITTEEVKNKVEPVTVWSPDPPRVE